MSVSNLARIETRPDAAAVEMVIAGGDLSKLTPGQRVSYLTALCESLGLNPLTRPFELLQLNGKWVVYARRDCTDQLRKRDHVSVAVVSRERIDDLLVVTTRATMPNGRADESIGAVSVAGLKGEALANAMMKADTKAKRRATLSICGLGFADESELDGSIAPQLPRITAHQDDPGFVHVETGAFEELSAKLATLENDLGGCETYEQVLALREMLGSKAKQSQLTKDIQAAGERSELDADQRKALGKVWQRINRQVEKLEASIKAPGVEASFVDADPEQDGR